MFNSSLQYQGCHVVRLMMESPNMVKTRGDAQITQRSTGAELLNGECIGGSATIMRKAPALALLLIQFETYRSPQTEIELIR
ncbi:hypothetical protein ABVF61_22360 [Roseibium sp. HPY-6]|uniref:hypothetical protein n=1 Tax=Roseibium sp. HPY-6 TaxID=3229852 RepID=UPI00338D6D6B